MNASDIEKSIIRKQHLLAQIFQQGILEIRDAEQLRQLLFLGIAPNVTGNVPSIQKLSSPRALYEIIFLLLQREEAVQILALDILQLKGPRYPSTDSFARGLSRFAAESAVDAKFFDRILDTYEQLYALTRKFPKPKNAPQYARDYHVGAIGHEISNPSYNEAFGDPKLRPIIVRNLIAQVMKRKGQVRATLLSGLMPITEEPVVDEIFRNIILHSTDRHELTAVFFLRNCRPAEFERNVRADGVANRPLRKTAGR